MLEWNVVCKDYSRCKLTYQSDKLPAFSGIARHFGSRCREDTYVTGVWLSQLPRALLWTVPRAERPRSRPPPTESGAPSWSWVSCAGPVEPSTVEDSFYVADVVRTLAEYKHKADQYGEVTKARIHMYGYVRRITSIMEEILPDDPAGDAYESFMQLDDGLKFRHLYVDGLLDRDIGYGPSGDHQFGEMADWFHGLGPVEYHCLFISVTQKTAHDDRVLQCLLLEPAESPGTFRRVGHISFSGRCALQMRYRLSTGQKEEADVVWDRMWDHVARYWGEAEARNETEGGMRGPTPVDIQATGPLSLYEFDGDLAVDSAFERLEPEIVTLL
ncbi:hypothetical protein F5Y16DRAFT_34491 [Xylariaceae sp. FL0255]|nr:hypothetical protein F5Y16DRAFT_34491 [Xylariaceae sp. FL0255]